MSHRTRNTRKHTRGEALRNLFKIDRLKKVRYYFLRQTKKFKV